MSTTEQIGKEYIEYFHKIPKNQALRFTLIYEDFVGTYPEKLNCYKTLFVKKLKMYCEIFGHRYITISKNNKTYFSITT